MIPDTIPSAATQGEKDLFQILQTTLSDEYIVWYEAIVLGRYPDFMILGPNFGLLVIEVKGWWPAQILKAHNKTFDIKRTYNKTSRIAKEQSPLEQARSYLLAVFDKFKCYPILCNEKGTHKGNLTFPVGVGAVMSNLTLEQATARNIEAVLEPPRVAYREELLEWHHFTEDQLLKRFKAMFTINFSFPTITEDQISTIKGILHPESKIKEIPATRKSISHDDELPVESTVILSLDIEQERIARTLTGGHRIFSGVAGSGKTLILIARAKAIANRLAGNKVLILCYNLSLAAYLRSLFHDDLRNPHYRTRIEVTHFHGWAKSILGRLPKPNNNQSDDKYDDYLGELVQESLINLPVDKKWNAVLVDEGHTFCPSWFSCCPVALKDPEKDDLMIVSDGNQKLYKRKNFTWKSVGIKVQGRGHSQYLNKNYRNTQETLSAAWNVVANIPEEEKKQADLITFPIIQPASALRSGNKPVLHLTKTDDHAVEEAVHKVKYLCNQGYASSDIAILYRYQMHDDRCHFQALKSKLHDLGLDSYWITESQSSKKDFNINHAGVRISTALSSLGLEFKAVLILWIDRFSDCYSDDHERAALARRQLYVAMTRAQDELHVFGGGSAFIINELKSSNLFYSIDYDKQQESA